MKFPEVVREKEKLDEYDNGKENAEFTEPKVTVIQQAEVPNLPSNLNKNRQQRQQEVKCH